MLTVERIKEHLDDVMQGRAPTYVLGAVQQVVFRCLDEAGPEDFRALVEESDAARMDAETERDMLELELRAVNLELEQEREVNRGLRNEVQQLRALVEHLKDQARHPRIRDAIAAKVGL